MLIYFIWSAFSSTTAWYWGGELKNYSSVTDLEQEWMVGKRLLFDDRVFLRVTSKGELGDYISLGLEYRLEFEWGDTKRFSDNAYFSSLQRLTDEPDSCLDLQAVIKEEQVYRLSHKIDRAWMRLAYKAVDLTIGRRALSWGVGYAWTPLDLVNPFAPWDFEKDVKPGRDLVLGEVALGSLAEVAVAYKPSWDREDHELSRDQSTLLGRWRFHVQNLDLALVGGQHRTDDIVGGSINGTLLGASWWLEGTYANAKERSDFFQAVGGMSYMFSGGTVLTIEGQYNTIGSKSKKGYLQLLIDQNFIARMQRGEIFTLGRGYLSWYVDHELTPLLYGGVQALVNLQDGSYFVGPSLQYSVANDLHLDVMLSVTEGARDTEFSGFEIPLGESSEYAAIANTLTVRIAYYW